jgi:ferredoxin
MPDRKPATGSRDDLVVDVTRCLKMRFSESSCRRCVDICPHNAVTLDGGLAIQPECRGCLLCTTVCPVGALEPQGDFSLCLAQLAKVPEPVLGCIRTRECSNATLPCLGGLADEHLLVLYQTLSGRLTFNLSLCDICPNKSMMVPLRQRLDAITAAGLSSSRCRMVVAESSQDIHYRDAAVDRRRFFKSLGTYLFKGADSMLFPHEQSRRRNEYAEKRVPARRELLNRTRKMLSPELEIRIRKRVDASVSIAEACTGCQGCVAICPTGALQTGLADMSPTFLPLLCTGCGLCHEFCLDGAVQVISRNNES